MKRFIIWIVSLLVMAFIVNTAGTLMVKNILADNLYVPAMRGYSKNGEAYLHPTPKEPTEKNKTNGLAHLAVRSMLDDERLPNKTSFLYNFLFMYVDIDQSVIFFEKDGMNEFSKGIYACPYEQRDELEGDDKFSYIRYILGLIDIREFCEKNNTEELYETLKANTDAVLKMDSYSIENFNIQPAKLTVLNGNGGTIKSFDFKCDGEIISADNVYIRNDNEGNVYNEYHSFCNKMTDAYLGERRVDKIAESLVDKVDFSGEDTYTMERSYGFGHYTAKTYEVKGDYSMICVMEFNFITDVLVYMGIFFIPITLLVFLLKRKKKNDLY